MIKRQRRRRRVSAEINVVPYIDVMLVLLVIFMVTAPMLTEGIQVSLPTTQARAIKSGSELPIVLSIDKAGNYFLNVSSSPQSAIAPSRAQARVMGLLSLAQTEKREAPGVYVKADQSVSYGTVAKAMALLQRAGASQVGLITQGLHRA